MQNCSGIVGNKDSVSRVVIFLIQRPYAKQNCLVFCQLWGGQEMIQAI